MSHENKQKPVLIGIAGPSGSGKTTFEGKLEEILKAYTITAFHMDAYFKPDPERPRKEVGREKAIYRDDNNPESFYWQQMIEDIRKAAESGVQVILVEGLFVLHYEELRGMLDLGIYMQCPVEERMTRRVRRNMGRGQQFEDIVDFYLHSARHSEGLWIEPTIDWADLIVSGKYNDKALEVIRAYCKEKLC